jgi:hypothetical protein
MKYDMKEQIVALLKGLEIQEIDKLFDCPPRVWETIGKRFADIIKNYQDFAKKL